MITPIVLCIAALVTAIYTCLVYRIGARPNSNSVVWNWWHRLISTSVSVLLGVVVAVQMFAYESKSETERTENRHLYLLKAEMSDTYRILQDNESMTLYVGSTNYPVLVTYIQPLAIEDAAKSGLFTALQTENLLHLARKMRMFNLKTTHYLHLIAQNAAFDSSYEGKVAHATRNVEETRASILEAIDLCRQQLGIDLSESVNMD